MWMTQEEFDREKCYQVVTHFIKEMFATSHNVSLGNFGTSYAIGTFTPTQFNVLSLYYNNAENIASARTYIYYR